MDKKELKKIDKFLWEVPQTYRSFMRVPARIYASSPILEAALQDHSTEQLINVSSLRGIVGYALAMPDIHEGYGFPIGGVAAIDTKEGVISPGGIGYDINCGTRLLISNVTWEQVQPYLPELIDKLFKEVPSGVGRGGKIRLSINEIDEVLEKGVFWALEKGFGSKNDIEVCEENGCFEGADSSKVSQKAKKRGQDQLGTLGSGNHFLEIQRVDKIFDKELAEKWGLFEGQITFQIHTGSRGLGHQVCTDYVNLFHKSVDKFKIELPDPELACVPFTSCEGQDYFAAMKAAANFAWANRHILGHYIRTTFYGVLKKRIKDVVLETLYDVAHNIAKVETHLNPQNQSKVEVCVHRKGATRAFPGQPVLIPGSMGTASYILVGTQKALEQTFGSTCHGAGRLLSRKKAKKQILGKKLVRDLEQSGILVRTKSFSGLAEEAPFAYKDIEEVVKVVNEVGISLKVARLRPLAVIKG